MSQTVEAPVRTARGHLVIAGLEKAYQSQKVVENLDLEVQPGEFVALLGPSGCGKTTVLRAVAGLVQPSAGDIRVDGISLLRRPIYKRDLGMVFQSYALFPHLKVRDNVAFGLKMRGAPKQESDRLVREALGLVRMEGFSERYPGQLSGGQQQRVALARAIVTNPTALLLDEPFSALDAKLRESMQVELRQLQKRLGITTIFVTHDQHEAMTMADRIAVMNAGRIEQFDSPQAIYEQPSTLFVAEFIGKTNRFSGTLKGREGGQALIQLAGNDKLCRARDNPQLQVGDSILAIVRPEKISLMGDGAMPNGYTGLMTGNISEIIFTGEKSMLFLSSPCGNVAVAAHNDSHRTAAGATSGKRFQLGWNASDMLIFPLQS
ncbi:ABC transporter ATP-binding protein [Candidimonas humi]|nr:ABC transporter ATP-binding protein [Candidimonas humi]